LCAVHTDPTPLPVPPPTDNAGEGWISARFVSVPVDRCTVQQIPPAAVRLIMGAADSQKHTGTLELHKLGFSIALKLMWICSDLLLCIMFHKSREFLGCLSALQGK